MAVKLRLKRMGMPKQPHYRLVAIDSHSARNAKELEILGHYHPRSKENVFSIKSERVKYWLSCGAQPSETVRSFLKREGILSNAAAKPSSTENTQK